MKSLLFFIYLLIFDYLFFGITAKLCGKSCNYNCKSCKNWACTHGVEPKPKSFYPVRDWCKWCNLEKRSKYL